MADIKVWVNFILAKDWFKVTLVCWRCRFLLKRPCLMMLLFIWNYVPGLHFKKKKKGQNTQYPLQLRALCNLTPFNFRNWQLVKTVKLTNGVCPCHKKHRTSSLHCVHGIWASTYGKNGYFSLFVPFPAISPAYTEIPTEVRISPHGWFSGNDEVEVHDDAAISRIWQEDVEWRSKDEVPELSHVRRNLILFGSDVENEESEMDCDLRQAVGIRDVGVRCKYCNAPWDMVGLPYWWGLI